MLTMETMIQTPEFDRLAFTVLAIEASAQKMNISPSEMRRRLEKVGLIKSLIQDCYGYSYVGLFIMEQNSTYHCAVS